MTGAAATFEYDSATTRATLRSELSELLRYRDLLGLLVSRTIKTRYKRSALGVAWTLLNPLVNMVVMSLAFSQIFHTLPNYPVYLLTGLIGWNFFSQSTAYAMGTLMWGGSILKRVYIPHTIFAVACIGNGLVNLAFSLVPLVLIMLAVGHPLHGTWWFLPVAVLILAVFSLGVALFVSALAVFFVDVLDMYQLLLQAWFFLTPILYPREVFSHRFAWALELNPMVAMVDLLRLPLFYGVLPGLATVAVASLWAAGALILGGWLFVRKSDEFAYRL
jgi:ABC-type polysaccharide/polyol phosphate export permease